MSKLTTDQRLQITGVVKHILQNEFKVIPAKHQIRDMRSRITFACPYCGDSSKDHTKKRGNLFWDSLYYHCYNDGCTRFDKQTHVSVIQFFKDFGIRLTENDNMMYIVDYINENKFEYIASDKVEYDLFPELKTLGISHDELKKYYYAYPINKFTDVYDYLKSRSLHKHLRDFAYNSYTNRLFILNQDIDRKSIIGFQIRDLNGSVDRYLTYNIERIRDKIGRPIVNELSNEELIKYNKMSTIFNILRVDLLEKLTLFEGPIDAKFMKNSIGLSTVERDTEAFQSLPLSRFFFDNDTAGKREMIQLIQKDQTVFLWTKFINDFKLNEYDRIGKLKDLNDLVKLVAQNKVPVKVLRELDNYFSNDKYDVIHV